MITVKEFVKDLENLTEKAELMAVTYKNNEIWKQIDKELISILTKFKKDKRIYGY